ncbi:MAG: glycine--tRNA ligase subunit beta [Rhodospirillaceae bacterium]|nr:glycine--tRNA ligase subunit beta [Rhodospirillaceae bacterium]
MSELLLEIFSEEIPARMQGGAADALAKLVGDALKAQGLTPKSLKTFGGSRRVTLSADGLPTAQPDISDERKGPSTSAAPQAIQGFLKATGFTDISQAEVRKLEKGEFYFAVIQKKGRPAADVLKEIIEAALAALPWPKSMRWATNPTRWVRPLHKILCVFDGKVVPVSFAGVTAGNVTVGHRFLAPAEITAGTYAEYVEKLRKAFVIIEPQERSSLIAKGVADLAAKNSLQVPEDKALLDEVIGLVEWPVPLLGTIDQAFMDVPREVLTSAMRKHQKYFALETKTGDFSNRFALIANMTATDGGAAIVAGNERVLRARLSDAKFFWDEDRKQKLDSRVEKLSERVFQEKLGTMRDKVTRVVALTEHLAAACKADGTKAKRAALLAKADLSTGMVGEFPDLQGLMGRYYALHDKEDAGVADAIAEHYSPLGPNDACPTKPLSIAVALADKIDTLVGFFAIDEKPTGSKDPFALRRAALGVIRLILENKLRLPLVAVFKHAVGVYGAKVKANADTLATDLLNFFADRLKVYLKDKGIRHDLISAVFALPEQDDLVRLIARVDALNAFISSDDGANLVAAYKRAANIVRIEEKKDKKIYSGEVPVQDLGQSEAADLFVWIETAEKQLANLLPAEEFTKAMAELAKLRPIVDRFFDKVTVNADDPMQRNARLLLLARVGSAMGRVADFSKLEG